VRLAISTGINEIHVRILLGMVGLFIACIGIFKLYLRRQLLKNGIRVPGTVISVDITHSSDNTRLYHPTFYYVTIKGEEVTYRSNVGYSPSLYSVNEKVNIVYDPTEKDNFVVDTFISNNIGYLIVLFGLIFLFTAAFIPVTAKP
jgi:hypothetical protein